LTKEAKEKQETFQARHAEYEALDKKFKETLDPYNTKRSVFQSRMSITDREAKNFEDMVGIINGQVNEVNDQIKLLVEKQQNFKDAASYVNGLSEDLKKNADELDKEINAHNQFIQESNAFRDEVLAVQKSVND